MKINQDITGATNVACVIGYPVAHSQSPTMHNAAFRELALDWIYVPFGVAPEDLSAAVSGLYALGVRGVNVTIPHKQAVMRLVSSISAEAAAIGSVNTLVRTAAGWHGHSTDGEGFLRGLVEHGVAVTDKRAVILGAGGAARAVVGALAQAGVGEITIVARHPERAQELQLLGQQNN
ncbi:MAG: shikimate dehydrogenase, partial [bacterium]